MPTSRPLPLICPDRVRQVPSSFAWIDHRLRSAGFLQRMTCDEVGLYLFLALAADQKGLSCWRLDRIERELMCVDVPSLRQAREGLVRMKLLGYRPWFSKSRDGSYQVLAIPAEVPKPRGVDPTPIGDLLSGLGGTCR